MTLDKTGIEVRSCTIIQLAANWGQMCAAGGSPNVGALQATSYTTIAPHCELGENFVKVILKSLQLELELGVERGAPSCALNRHTGTLSLTLALSPNFLPNAWWNTGSEIQI